MEDKRPPYDEIRQINNFIQRKHCEFRNKFTYEVELTPKLMVDIVDKRDLHMAQFDNLEILCNSAHIPHN